MTTVGLSANEIARSTVTEVVDAANDQYHALTAMIRRNPWQSAGAALGIGVVAALMVRSLTKPRR